MEDNPSDEYEDKLISRQTNMIDVRLPLHMYVILLRYLCALEISLADAINIGIV